MDYVTTVRVLVQETRQPIAGAYVELFDRDEHSEDDKLGEGKTNMHGEVLFKYSSADFNDGLLRSGDENRLTGDSVPDLYPVVYDATSNLVVSKRGEATNNKAALNILVLVDQVTALKHKLISE